MFQYVSTSTTINDTTDFVVIGDGTSVLTFTLPPAASVPKGKIIVFKRNRANVTGTIGNANYYVNTVVSDKIIDDFSPTSSNLVYTTSYPHQGVIRLICDGVSTWRAW